ncbi:hypothetical protein ACFWAF_02910 [Streptomyces microflavus]|uniref:hypothetical protein n=1 Tax=Streptomyces microflavus TaxID=1919 RepID=UPI00366874B3
MSITAEQVKEAYQSMGSLPMQDGTEMSYPELVRYIDECDVDQDENGDPLNDQWQMLADVLGAPDLSDVNELVEITAAVNRLAAAEQDRDDKIRAAVAAGHPVIAIAGHARLSRARIYQIRDGRR